jgi:undecaprenyl-diphosphatase
LPESFPPTPEPGHSESAWHRFKHHSRWGIVTETTVLATLLLLVTLLYAFVQIADEVREQETVSFDTAILQWFRNPSNMEHTKGPHWLQTAALDVTALGGTTVLIFVVLVTLGFLWIAKKRKAFFLVAAAAIGGQVFNSVLKEFFSRPRPSVVPHLAEVHSSSFPSGHSMMSAVIYLTLGALISRLVAGSMLRAYIMGVALFLTLAVGLTRVFLGVHYPTDVLAGWSAGLSWALICLLVARILQHRGKVEQPGERTEHPLAEK